MEGNVAQNKTSDCLIPMVGPQPLASTNAAELVPPGNMLGMLGDTNQDLDYT